MKEIWKDIKGYENLYQVSNLGRVRSLDRKVKCFSTSKIIKGKIIKQEISKCGYYRVQLSNKSIVRHYAVHRLVLMAFKPIEDAENLVVNHLDYNTKNNRLDNLEWCTIKENLEWSRDNINDAVRKSCGKKIYQYDLNDNFIRVYDSCNLAQKETNICNINIRKCCNKKRKTAGGYKWSFGSTGR